MILLSKTTTHSKKFVNSLCIFIRVFEVTNNIQSDLKHTKFGILRTNNFTSSLLITVRLACL